ALATIPFQSVQNGLCVESVDTWCAPVAFVLHDQWVGLDWKSLATECCCWFSFD
ncbi:unnamed protein product, partial [Brassica napus]